MAHGHVIVVGVSSPPLVLHKSTEYDVVYYLPEDTCHLEDEIEDVAEWSKAEEVTRWLAIMKPIDSRFPKSLADRFFGLRTHPIVRELPPSPFWKRPDVAADLPAASEAMQWLGAMGQTEAGAIKVMMSARSSRCRSSRKRCTASFRSVCSASRRATTRGSCRTWR